MSSVWRSATAWDYFMSLSIERMNNARRYWFARGVDEYGFPKDHVSWAMAMADCGLSMELAYKCIWVMMSIAPEETHDLTRLHRKLPEWVRDWIERSALTLNDNNPLSDWKCGYEVIEFINSSFCHPNLRYGGQSFKPPRRRGNATYREGTLGGDSTRLLLDIYPFQRILIKISKCLLQIQAQTNDAKPWSDWYFDGSDHTHRYLVPETQELIRAFRAERSLREADGVGLTTDAVDTA